MKAFLIVAFVAASGLTGGGPQRAITGDVGEYVAGKWLSVANETTDPTGVQIALRETTAYEGDPVLIEPGVRVTVWYRSTGERRPVADTVRVVSGAAAR